MLIKKESKKSFYFDRIYKNLFKRLNMCKLNFNSIDWLFLSLITIGIFIIIFI
ncbi:hypothetical protein AELL_1449 [Arcobacter ellisii]|uniref:Uncharacterized protein n=1 Tax=Arcobacter ellisii TaxID=913109 RepID=A0ABM6YLM1_9BACT|nr:hypothetical protein AELL_1449 [Arcobacter ellisii]